jgi:hypothetical protein
MIKQLTLDLIPPIDLLAEKRQHPNFLVFEFKHSIEYISLDFEHTVVMAINRV